MHHAPSGHKWSGVDKIWEQHKLEATRARMPESDDESRQSGVCFAGRPFAWINAGS